MSELLKTFLDLIDRFPALAWRMGLSCLGLGAAVFGSIWMGFVRHEAFNGYVEDAARVAIALGIGFLSIGTVLTFGRMVVRVFEWFGRRRRRSERTELLLQNLEFLTTNAQLILY